jgi:hypothetical protein
MGALGVHRFLHYFKVCNLGEVVIIMSILIEQCAREFDFEVVVLPMMLLAIIVSHILVLITSTRDSPC